MNKNPRGEFPWFMNFELLTNILISRYTLVTIDTTKALNLIPAKLFGTDVEMLSNVNEWAISSLGTHSLTEK